MAASRVLAPADREPIEGVRWVTWADEWRELLENFAAADPPEADFVWVESPLLDITYRVESWSLPLEAVPADVRAGLLRMAEVFLDDAPKWLEDRGVVLLTDMLDELGDYGAEFIGCLREAMVEVSGSKRQALAIPVGSFKGPMPLHVDLNGPSLLFNFFGQVPTRWARKRGASYLTSVGRLIEVLHRAEVPEPEIMAITELIAQSRHENYALFSEILYADNAWSREVEDALFTEAEIVFQFEEGEGYFADDRRWLHGRGDITWRGVQDHYRRLYRLTFERAGVAVP